MKFQTLLLLSLTSGFALSGETPLAETPNTPGDAPTAAASAQAVVLGPENIHEYSKYWPFYVKLREDRTVDGRQIGRAHV